MIHKHHHRSEVTFYWSKAHSEQSLKAHVYTHMNINPEWIYWLAKISWHSDINFTVFVLQIVIILPWKKRWHYSLRCLCCSISHVSVVLWQTKGVMENKMQMGQRGEISLKQKNRTLARPWFCINLYWNVNEYKKKITFDDNFGNKLWHLDLSIAHSSIESHILPCLSNNVHLIQVQHMSSSVILCCC